LDTIIPSASWTKVSRVTLRISLFFSLMISSAVFIGSSDVYGTFERKTA